MFKVGDRVRRLTSNTVLVKGDIYDVSWVDGSGKWISLEGIQLPPLTIYPFSAVNFELVKETRMKKEDFKQMTEEHVEACKKIIARRGTCAGVDCRECPFAALNNTKGSIPCHEYGYVGSTQTSDSRDLLAGSAKKFLDLYYKKEHLTKDEMVHEMVVNRRTLVDIHGNKAWYDTDKNNPFRIQMKGVSTDEYLNLAWVNDWKVYSPYEDWEIDDKIIVWNNSDSVRHERHFAGIGGRIMPLAWDYGKTSYTTKDRSYWNYAELYVEGDE